MEEIRLVTDEEAAQEIYTTRYADILILTAENKILLQYRPIFWRSYPDKIVLFGGHIESGETPLEAAIREIQEETGGLIKTPDLVSVATISEAWTMHTELVHLYFWHDKKGTIRGCYEAESLLFETAAEAMAHAKLMPYAKWALEECVRKRLIG